MINFKGKVASPRFLKLKKDLERGKIVSPRLRKLKKDLERAKNKKKIIDEFWKAIEENGTPIIEAIEKVLNHKLVTFIYKENSDTDKILLACDGLGVIPRRWKFTRLQGTDIYYKSIFYLNKTRINYAIHKASISLEDIPLFSPKDYLRPLKGDPLNKQNFTFLPGFTLAPLELPDAPLQSWIEKKDNVPEGKLEALRLKSAKFNDEFYIKIYLPPNYNHSTEPYGSLFLFDGYFYTNPNRIPTPTILDNLIFSKKIPPIIAVFICNQIATRNRELHTNPNFAYFIAEELLPHLKEKFNLSNNPERTIVGGCSLGGLTGSYIGLKYPDKFGKILSQSAPHWVPETDDARRGFLTKFLKIDPHFQNWQYLIGEYVKREKLPLDFYIEVGVYEGREAIHGGPSFFFSNRHFRDVLLSKGYSVKYIEFIGGHDFICWRGTLADGLIYLIGSQNNNNKNNNKKNNNKIRKRGVQKLKVIADEKEITPVSEGKVAVITGGASGIGRGLALSFAERGMKIVLADIDKKNLDKVAKELEEIGAEVMTQITDVSDPEQVAQLADASYERFGSVNILCNNAGVGGAGPIKLLTLENWNWTLGVNLFGVIYGIHYFLKRMLASKEPCHIVNISSMSGLLSGDSAPYPASKFAVVAISEALELECVNTNVNVSVVCPGHVKTNILKNSRNLSLTRSGLWQPTPEMNKQSRIAIKNISKILRSGITPKRLAELVIKAIENDIFYVLTHPEYIPMIKSRYERINEDTLKLHEGIEAENERLSKIYKNDTPSFSLAYPESFIKLKPNPMSFPVDKPVFVASKIPSVDLLIFVFNSSKYARPLEETVQEIARRLEARSREINIVSNKQISLRDGTPAYESVIEFKFLGIYKVKSLHLSVLKEDHLIVINIWARANYFNENLKEILHSLEFN